MGGTQGRIDHSFLMPLPVALGVAAINQAIKEGKAAQTERVLRNPAVALRGVVPDHADGYQRVLEDAMAKKRCSGNGLSLTPILCRPSHLLPPPTLLCLLGFCLGDTAFWVQHDMKDGTAYYFHLQTFQGTWERPLGCHLNTSHLTREEIQVGRAPTREGTMGEGSPVREAPTCKGTTGSFSCLHSQLSPRSLLPMTANSSGRPTLALSSNSRPVSVASWFGRSLPSACTF